MRVSPTRAGCALLTVAFVLAWSSPALAAAGDLDPSFGGDGRVSTHVDDRYSGANAVAIQADGAIVVVGSASSSQGSALAVVRYLSGGALDATFGGDGRVTTPVGGGTCDTANVVAIQPDGKIVVAGSSGCRHIKLVLVRYGSDGTPDNSFGGDGIVVTPFGGPRCDAEAFGVAIQPDGKIVAAGMAKCRDAKFAAVRYETDGTLDPSFSGDGWVTIDVTSAWDIAYGVAVQADGRIVMAGAGATETDGARFALVRLNADGTRDTTFGGDGKVTTPPTDCIAAARAIAIQADGKIVVAGFDGCIDRFAIARYRTNGHLDPGFGGDGTVTTSFTCPQSDANAVAIQPDGKIVAAGFAVCAAQHDYLFRFGVARYDADGTLDATFGSGGIAVTPFSCESLGNGVALQGDGNIVEAGVLLCDRGSKFAAVRYLGS
jgi:uncharacterized delta-60 repeat protein